MGDCMKNLEKVLKENSWFIIIWIGIILATIIWRRNFELAFFESIFVIVLMYFKYRDKVRGQ